MNDSVICINNDSNPASLIAGKAYRVLPDADAAAHDMIRIVDEDTSEMDGYLYPAAMFVPIDLPEAAKQSRLYAPLFSNLLILRQAQDKSPVSDQ